MPYYKDKNNNIHWLDSEKDSQSLPEGSVESSKEEVIEIINTQKKIAFNALSYKEKRRAEYPSVRDYLDGLVKGDQEQIDKYISDCLAVKQKYPKP
jgi:flagellar biosynthesis/type III secretory pathway chaperone